MKNDYDKDEGELNTAVHASCSSSEITAELPNIQLLIAKYLSEDEQSSEGSSQQNKKADKYDS